MGIMRQSACLVINPITVHSYGFLFNFTILTTTFIGELMLYVCLLLRPPWLNNVSSIAPIVCVTSPFLSKDLRIQRRGQGVRTPSEKSQKYRVSQQYWSGSPGKSQSCQSSIQCWAIEQQQNLGRRLCQSQL